MSIPSVEIADGIATITMNRPTTLNAIMLDGENDLEKLDPQWNIDLMMETTASLL